MNKISMAFAGVMFLSVNLYAQQEEPKIKEEIKYIDNDTNKIDTKTTLKYGSNDKVIEATISKYKYSESILSVVETTKKIFNTNGNLITETFEKDVYNRITGEIKAKEITTNAFIAGRMRLTYQESDETDANREVTKNTYNEITGEILQTTIYIYTFTTIAGKILKVLEGCTVATDSETSYNYSYNSSGLLTVAVAVRDKNRALTGSRSYEFNSDLSLGAVDTQKGPKPDKIEQKKEAEFILSLMK